MSFFFPTIKNYTGWINFTNQFKDWKWENRKIFLLKIPPSLPEWLLHF